MKRKTKMILIVFSIALLLAAAIGGTVAYLKTETAEVKNIFTPSEVTCEIHEDEFAGAVKTNVYVENTGNTDAYIRAAIVVTWKDENGKVYGKAPELGTDYTWELNTADWTKNGNYYYHNDVVKANNGSETDKSDETSVLIITCSPVAGTAPGGYNLNVEILAQAIQTNAVSSANDWTIKPVSNN